MSRPDPLSAAFALPLRDRLLATRELSFRLAEPVGPEDAQLQSMADASPLKWHLAHTSWFFETFVLKPRLPGYGVFDEAFEYLFNSYYNGIGRQYPRAERGLMSRPSLAEVIAYRRHVDASLARLFEAGMGTGAASLLELGLNHEQQHQELILTDIKHLLSRNPRRPAYRDRSDAGIAGPSDLAWLRHDGGMAGIGADARGFAYDNERPRHEVRLYPFELASRLATVAEYRDFIRDGGYRRAEYWLADGWDWVQSTGVSAPLYWSDDQSSHYTLAGERPLQPQEPVVHVSYYEADAYARWAAARLPREGEWEAVASRQAISGNLLDLDRLHPLPAPVGTAGLIRQMFGDAWEWTQSAYCAYPGYRPAEGAIGEYNGKFMVNQMVLRGGSCATPPGHLRASYRNFFPPTARWQFSGIRLARDA